MTITILVFVAYAVLTLGVGFLSARKRPRTSEEHLLASRDLKWPLVALSAGATANSGFIMTTAVAMGYAYGLLSLLLPFAFFLGSYAFWHFFPQRITKVSHDYTTTTIPDTLTIGFTTHKRFVALLASLIILLALIFYTAGQWRASGIVLSGFSGLSVEWATVVSGVIVALYSSIGGFRSTVWTDSLQAITLLVMVPVLVIYTYLWLAVSGGATSLFTESNHAFEVPAWGKSSLAIGAYVLGWAVASFGYGASQPAIINKFYAARSPEDARRAKWLYLFFVSFTWVGMTFIGMMLHGIVTTTASDDLIVGVLAVRLGPIMQGLTLAAIFAAIASTASSFLIAMSSSVQHDLLQLGKSRTAGMYITGFVSLITIVMSVYLANTTVFGFIASSILILGSGIAPAVMIKVLRVRNSPTSIALCMVCGLAAALLWQYGLGFSDTVINETVPGMVIGFTVNWLVIKTQGWVQSA